MKKQQQHLRDSTRSFIPRRLPLAVTLAIMPLSSFGTAAPDPAVPFDIPAQKLADALPAYTKQGHVQVLYQDKLAMDTRSTAVKGVYTPAQALDKLLQGTTVQPRFTGEHSATLEPRPAKAMKVAAAANEVGGAAAGAAGTDITTLPKIVVNAAPAPQEDEKAYAVTKAYSATKTDTPLMETPVNIQVLPKAVLDDQQTIQMTEAMKNVSGVNISIGSGGLSDDIYLRGFRTSTYFRNGFRIDSGYASIGTRQMANVERLEVIKGPASVMYGRMEPGGMVNVVTKTPLSTPYYSLQQQFGSYGLFRTTADATGPLTEDDTLLYRFNASFESTGSFRDLVDNQRIFLAPIITWNISPQTQASLEMEYRHDDLNYDNMAWPYLNGEFISKPISTNLMERAPTKVDETLVAFNWSHQFNDDWKIMQRFAADLLDNDQVWISGATSDLNPDNTLPRSYTRVKGGTNTYYTTIDLTGHFETWGVKHTLLTGGDFYRTDNIFNPYVADIAPIDVYHPVHNDMLLSPLTPAGWAGNNSANYFGAYLQDQVKLPYGLQIMAGFRYQYVKQWDNLAHQDLASEDDVTPRFGLLWQPQDWVSVYGNYIENFGNSNSGARTSSGSLLPPESAQQWEGGVKFEFFDGRLSATLAYFDITKQNVVTRDPNDPTGLFSVAAGEVRSQGPEVDIRGEILPGWNMIVTYANLDTRVTKDNNGLQGNRLYAIPRNMGSLWSTYTFQKGDLEGLKFGAGVTSRDGTADGAGSGYETAGYTTVDLLAAYTFKVGKSKLTAQLNVNNLLDKHYFTDVYLCGACSTRSIGTPRSFLGALKVEF